MKERPNQNQVIGPVYKLGGKLTLPKDHLQCYNPLINSEIARQHTHKMRLKSDSSNAQAVHERTGYVSSK